MRINSAAAVNVCVEDYAEISTEGLYSLAYRSHCICILRVRDVVRECTVRLEELTSSYVCAECFKNICCIEAADTVSGINNKPESFQRMMVVVFVVYLLLDEFTQIACIVSHVFVFCNSAAAAVLRLVLVLSVFEDSGDVSALKSALTGEEFKTVFIVGMMACGDLYSAVAAKLYCCHKHCRC